MAGGQYLMLTIAALNCYRYCSSAAISPLLYLEEHMQRLSDVEVEMVAGGHWLADVAAWVASNVAWDATKSFFTEKPAAVAQCNGGCQLTGSGYDGSPVPVPGGWVDPG
jgi:hypothetical protein